MTDRYSNTRHSHLLGQHLCALRVDMYPNVHRPLTPKPLAVETRGFMGVGREERELRVVPPNPDELQIVFVV